MDFTTRFYILTTLIIFFAIIIRILPLLNNNFYFTMDQGYDAVNAREILRSKKIILTGPETNVKNIFAGPGWFYLLSLGLGLFAGHPAGGIIPLISLNIILTLILIIIVSHKVSPLWGLLIGLSLQIYWWFYDTSRYAFNPFPNVFLTALTILLLAGETEKKKELFIISAIPVGLAFHFEVAFTVVLGLFYLTVGTIFLLRKSIRFPDLIFGLSMIVVVNTPFILYELKTNFSQIKAFSNHMFAEGGTFSQTQERIIINEYKEIAGQSIFPQHSILGTGLLLLLIVSYIRQKDTNAWRKRIVFFTLLLIIISFLFFLTNSGWRQWHTAPIPVVIFFSILLIFSTFSSKTSIIATLIIFILQSIFFFNRYKEYLYVKSDSGILKNQIAAIDWIYKESKLQGFYVYHYVPSVYDYNFQYTIFWHGKNAYGYVPCEYATNPGAPEDLIIPGWSYYQHPKKKCTPLRFLIMEKDINGAIDQKWYAEVIKNTDLLKTAKFGDLLAEKRIIKNN